MPEAGVPGVDVHEGDDSSELPLVAPPAVEVGAGPLHGARVLVGACRGGNSLESYVGKFKFGGKCRRRRLQKGKIEKNRNEPKDVKSSLEIFKILGENGATELFLWRV